ncbi:hypothetical protein AG1IA_08110 [Rhizoctonia solani AG-1 IA]|uniref:Uncharacterized protein n=1 Tax=Thanatephorus cucumeris (strain AG1-IA) TaxID=983506 RepID=L8WNE0_THACA|nr:hypothetical protein AG1IA_08110 [Rhizoctonia solani AG-1 IA]
MWTSTLGMRVRPREPSCIARYRSGSIEEFFKVQPINESKGPHALARLDDPDYSPILGAIPTEKSRFKPAQCYGKTLLWVKLSNSGDTLKHMVPSYSRKAISGWSNYPGTVTSHMMNENEMGYRGSKSDFILESVKEQRVDGSCCIHCVSYGAEMSTRPTYCIAILWGCN